MTKIENFEFIFRIFKCSTHGLESLEGELNFSAGSVTTFSRLITQGFGNYKFWLLEIEFSSFLEPHLELAVEVYCGSSLAFVLLEPKTKAIWKRNGGCQENREIFSKF